ncbi:SdpI family protein [Pengzhenrongella phosphoraccumulans]|uniref:SdpI family protein n=1 Tax=Pengzhenrongella phosphoraccumulans TaxID=3114394 RepID=UPI00388E422A
MACSPVFKHVARGEPNPWSGYRTARAIASTRNWREANLLAGRYWLRYGARLGVVCVLTYAGLYFSGNRDISTWQNVAFLLAVVGLGVMAGTCLPIERRLAAMDRDATIGSSALARRAE